MKFKAIICPRKNKAGEVPIYIRISDANKDRYVSLGIHLKPQFWNKKSGKVRQNDYYEADAINALIDQRLSEVEPLPIYVPVKNRESDVFFRCCSMY